jgi:hypothetical protein
LSSNEKKQLILLSEHQLRNLAKIQWAVSFSPSSLSTAKWQNIAGSKKFFRPDQFILVATNSFWSRPFHFGRDQIIIVKSKTIWSDQNHFGPTKTVLVT